MPSRQKHNEAKKGWVFFHTKGDEGINSNYVSSVNHQDLENAWTAPLLKRYRWAV